MNGASDPVTLTIAALIALILIIAMILAYKIVRRQPRVGATRIGLFIERDYDDLVEDDVADTKVLWPKEDK